MGLIGYLLTFYSAARTRRTEREEKEHEIGSNVRIQAMLSTDEQVKLLWKSGDAKDALILALQAKHEAQLLELAECKAQTHIKDWELKNMMAERDQLKAQLNALARPRAEPTLGPG